LHRPGAILPLDRFVQRRRIQLNSALAETDVQHLSRPGDENGEHQQADSKNPPDSSPGESGSRPKGDPVFLSARVRIALWLVVALAALGFSFQWTASTSVHNDFTQNVWLPSRLVLNGVNPYRPTREQVDAALGEYKSAFSGFNSGSDYHFI